MNEIQNSFGRKIKRFRSDKEKGVRYFWGPFMVDIGAQTPFFYTFGGLNNFIHSLELTSLDSIYCNLLEVKVK